MTDFNKIMDMVLDEAIIAKHDAAMGGCMGDGGASVLIDQVRFFKLGWAKQLPKEWKHHVLKADPEYQTYLKLKEKFEA